MAGEQVRALRIEAQTPQSLRQALVIGNSEYRVSRLSTPVNDARLIADALRLSGFSVTLLDNADRAAMLQAIARFGEQLDRGGVGLFYYAGHGLQVKGENWLIPVDADIRREEDVLNYGVNLQQLLDRMMAAHNPLNLVFLDACRNNPYPKATRSLDGLARVDAGLGMLIAFSTAPGQTALDGDTNSPFAAALSRHIPVPGLSVESMLKRVRSDVRQATRNRQITWDNSSLEGDFYFKPASPITSSAPQAVTPTPLSLSTLTVDDPKVREYFPNYQGPITGDDLFRARELGERFKHIGEPWVKWMTDTTQQQYSEFLRDAEAVKARYALRGKEIERLPIHEQRAASNAMLAELQQEMALKKQRFEQGMAQLSQPFSRFIDEFKLLLQSKQLDAAEVRLNQAEEQFRMLQRQ